MIPRFEEEEMKAEAGEVEEKTGLNKDQAIARRGSYDVEDHIKNGKGEEAANAVIAVLSK